ncbi:MAG: hypothetical protein J6A53_06720 [Clostridia bacterium]|nr:hypothetical protein [Clostridia bacterium]MBO5440327.1 hypothetical protein [Clostridia bacterium]
MKISISSTLIREDKKIKNYFEILLLVFTLTAITVILSLSQMDEKINDEKPNTEDYVSVFKESELHEILFSQAE